MRNLNNLDEAICVLVDAEEPVRAILADKNVKNLWRGGTYLDVLFYLLRERRAELYAVIAALDGETDAGQVAETYSPTEVVRLFRDLAGSDEIRRLFALFTAAGTKKDAGSSGSLTANTGA